MAAVATTPLTDLAERVRVAVERFAANDPNPLDPFRGLYLSDEAAVGLARGGGGVADERLVEATARLSLDPLDAAVLAACAAAELDPRYGRLYGYLHDDLTRRLPSPRLIARLLSESEEERRAVLRRFDARGALARSGAIRVLPERDVPSIDRSVRVSARLAAFLQDVELDESRPRVVMPADGTGAPVEVVDQLRGELRAETRLPIIVAGPDAARAVAAAAERPVVIASISDIVDSGEADLEAALLGGIVAFDGVDEVAGDAWRPILAALVRRRGTVICAPSRTAVTPIVADLTATIIEARLPDHGERTAIWASHVPGADVVAVAAKFRLSASAIAEAADAAAGVAASRASTTIEPGDLDAGARAASSGRLAELATRVEPRATWEDLVLPDRQREVLGSIAAYLRHRDQVLAEWGYERVAGAGLGMKVLFAGESGTGKTLAASVLAHALGLEMFRLDLATVVSKYIGETEKNLDRIFAAADGSNAILFFDEADALFGKRSEVRDAHDRYANIEVAYLLQRMEQYPGCVMLATNFRQNIDEAFLRRLDFVVDFPFPEPADRERIWQVHLPSEAPFADDVNVPFLAERFTLAGGNIRNASIAAAFMAADEGTAIGMRQLIRAVSYEYAKLGRLTLEADFEGYLER